MAAKVEEERWIVCPASGYLHAPVARPIYPSSSKKAPAALCDCHTRVWLPRRRWQDDFGLRLEDVRAQGFSIAQVDRFEHSVGTEEARVIPCPAGGILHPGAHAVAVAWVTLKKSQKLRAHALCSCGTHVWFGSPMQESRWTKTMGLTADQARSLGLTITG